MAEGNGIVQRIVGVESAHKSLRLDLREQRSELNNIGRLQERHSEKIDNLEDGYKAHREELAGLRRALWAFAGTFFSLTVMAAAVVVTLLTGGG